MGLPATLAVAAACVERARQLDLIDDVAEA